MDRIDIRIDVERTDLTNLRDARPGKSSAELREEIIAAQEFKRERLKRRKTASASAAETVLYSVFEGKSNKLLELFSSCDLDKEANDFLSMSVKTGGLSSRSVVKILSIARTIADLDRSVRVGERHIAEAYTLRFHTNEGSN